MERGVDNLSTIASVAPLLGLLITTQGIAGSFIGCIGEASACKAIYMERISNAITPAAVGLIVGLIALSFYRYLRGKLERLDVEMTNATLELANLLIALPRQTDGNRSPGE